MQAYSQDLRKKIVGAVKATNNQTQVAALFQVSLSTVKRYLKLEASDSTLTPKKRPGRPSTIPTENYSCVTALLEAKNDLTMQELSQLWQELYQQKLNPSTFSRLLARAGWTRKKRVWQPPNVTSKPETSSKPTRLP